MVKRMENFIYSIPTTVYFGRGKLKALGEVLAQYGSRVLLVYGRGSIKKNGCYQEILSQCKEYGIAVWELGGVTSNPDIGMVRSGAQICKREHIQIIVAAGGGSVLDCGKLTAAAALADEDPWDIVTHPETIETVLPIIAIPTVAGSGSEMDYTAVISNEIEKQKIACGCKKFLPKAAFLDPTYTITLGMKEIAEGIADTISHVCEIYFSRSRAFFQERLCEAVVQTCIHAGQTLIHTPEDYDARANLMWAACWAMNGFLRWGKPGGWTCHVIAHELGALHSELPHGRILAVLLPKWLRLAARKGNPVQMSEWAANVWNIREENKCTAAEHAIEALEKFFQQLGLPNRLELQMEIRGIDHLVDRIYPKLQGCYVDLSREDVYELILLLIDEIPPKGGCFYG